MTDFKKGDRVIIVSGNYKGESGKVLDDLTGSTSLQRSSKVELDNYDNYDNQNVRIPNMDLNLESLIENLDEEIENLSTEIARVASGLAGNIREELRTHSGYLKESLRSKDQSRFDQQSRYISSELKMGVQNNSVELNSKRNITTNLKRLEYWLQQNP